MKTIDIIANGLLADDSRMQLVCVKWIFEGLNSPFDGLLSLEDVDELINRPYNRPHDSFVIPWDYIFEQMIRRVVSPDYAVQFFMFFDMKDPAYAPKDKFSPKDTQIEKKMVELMKMEAVKMTNSGRANALLSMLTRVMDFKLTQPRTDEIFFGYYTTGALCISWYFDVFRLLAAHQINKISSESALHFYRYAEKLSTNENEDIKQLGLELMPMIVKNLRQIENLKSVLLDNLWNPLVTDNISLNAADFPKQDYINMLRDYREILKRDSTYGNCDKINHLTKILENIP